MSTNEKAHITCFHYFVFGRLQPVNLLGKGKHESGKGFCALGEKNAVPFSLNDGGKDQMLAAIDEAIGDAKVVAVSEAAHNVKEFISTNAAIVEYLVKNKGFNTIVVESGFPESRIVHDYILGKQVDKATWIGGLNEMYARWTEFTDMIEWMREYNQSVGDDNKIKFYGLDITGYYTDLRPTFRQIIDVLEKTAPVYTREICSELNPILDVLGSDGYRKAPLSYKDSLTLKQKYLLEEKLVELTDFISDNKDNILASCSNEDYEWLRQNAISLFHTITYYKDNATKDKEYHEYVGRNGRELAMAHNLQWVYKSDTTANILIINHTIHTKTQASYFTDNSKFFVPLGAFIRESFGSDYYSIGCAYDNGEYWDNWKKDEPRIIKQTASAKEGEIDYTLKSVDKPYFFIDFRKIDRRKPAYSWLKSEIMTREHDVQLPIIPDEFDGYIYYNTISIPTEN